MTIKIDDLEEKLKRMLYHLTLATVISDETAGFVKRILEYEGEVARREIEDIRNMLANQSVEIIHIKRLLLELIS